MNHLKLFESFSKYNFDKIDQMEIENYLLHWIDEGDIRLGEFEKYDATEVSTFFRSTLDILFGEDKLDYYLPSISFSLGIKHTYGIRNASFDITGYTKARAKQFMQRLYNDYNVNIFIWVKDVDFMAEYISKSYVIIQPKPDTIKENFSQETIEYIESFFIELSDYKDDEYPIVVSTVYPVTIGKDKHDGYEIRVDFDTYDKYFMEKKIELIKLRLERDFVIRSSSVGKSGQYRTKEIQVHGDPIRTSTVQDPIYRWSIRISPKFKEIF